MRLVPLLFENVIAEATDFNNLALYAGTRSKTATFVLYDVTKLANAIARRGLPDVEDEEFYMHLVAAYVSLTKFDKTSQCAGAWSVSYAARNPEYSGSGQLIYELASSYLKAPITSDRDGSSSKDAKNLWKKIASNSNFRKIELDNWYWRGGVFGQQYADVDPRDNEVTDRDEPRTPEIEDDCQLPARSAEFAKRNLGTGDAFEASVDVQPYRRRHKEAMKMLSLKDPHWASLFDVMITASGKSTFSKYYKG